MARDVTEPLVSPAAGGRLLSLTAAFWAAVFLLPYQAAARAVGDELLVVVLLMVGWAALFNSLMVLLRRPPSWRSWRLDRLGLITVVILAGCTVLGNIGMAASLALVEPAVTSVVLQMQLVVIALAEAALLRTRLRGSLIVGAVLALFGFVIMQAPWQAVAGDADASMRGAAWALLPVLCFATMLVLTRHVIDRIDPVLINAVRLWLATGILALLPGVAVAAWQQSWWVWGMAALAAASGPTISRLMLMYAVRSISATENKLITLVAPLFALILGVVILDVWPAARELLGGGVILAGVAWALWRARQSEATPAADTAHRVRQRD